MSTTSPDQATSGRRSRKTSPADSSKPIAVPLAKINLKDSVQPRVATSDETVEDYMELLSNGRSPFPPVELDKSIESDSHYLRSGFHRFKAYKKAGKKIIRAIVREWKTDEDAKRQAFLGALGENADHGLQRTRADKRHAVELALDDPELSALDLRRIGEICKVSHEFVRKVKNERNGVQNPVNVDSVDTSERQTTEVAPRQLGVSIDDVVAAVHMLVHRCETVAQAIDAISAQLRLEDVDSKNLQDTLNQLEHANQALRSVCQEGEQMIEHL